MNHLPYPVTFAQNFYIHAHGVGCLELIERKGEKSLGIYRAQWEIIEKLTELYKLTERLESEG